MTRSKVKVTNDWKPLNRSRPSVPLRINFCLNGLLWSYAVLGLSHAKENNLWSCITNHVKALTPTDSWKKRKLSHLHQLSVRHRWKKHRLVVEVESLVSSLKKLWRIDVKTSASLWKNVKSRWTFNRNSYYLLTAITHTKILVAYFITSD